MYLGLGELFIAKLYNSALNNSVYITNTHVDIIHTSILITGLRVCNTPFLHHDLRTTVTSGIATNFACSHHWVNIVPSVGYCFHLHWRVGHFKADKLWPFTFYIHYAVFLWPPRSCHQVSFRPWPPSRHTTWFQRWNQVGFWLMTSHNLI